MLKKDLLSFYVHVYHPHIKHFGLFVLFLIGRFSRIAQPLKKKVIHAVFFFFVCLLFVDFFCITTFIPLGICVYLHIFACSVFALVWLQRLSDCNTVFVTACGLILYIQLDPL